MIKYLELTAPESSEFRQCKVTSIEVNEGDTVKAGDALFKVLSGKNEIDLPSKLEGKVIEVIATQGESISLMTPLVLLETEVEHSTATAPIIEPETNIESEINVEHETNIEPEKDNTSTIDNIEEKPSKTKKQPKAKKVKKTNKDEQQQQLDLGNDIEPPQDSDKKMSKQTTPISVPDIGGDSAKVIEILVNVGDTVSIEDPLVTLESDKASMDVPSTHDGVITKIVVEVDQDISEGVVIVELETQDSASVEAAATTEAVDDSIATKVDDSIATKEDTADKTAETDEPEAKPSEPRAPTSKPASQASTASSQSVTAKSDNSSHASPSIRLFARELGVDLSLVTGTGRKNRITKTDVNSFVKAAMTSSTSSGSQNLSGSGIPAVPEQDFSKFGEIDIQPLNNIKRATAQNLHRSWLNVPHVTHSDEANISDLEQFRKQLNAEYKQQDRGIKLSPLAFIVKAVVNAMRTYPQFNSSLESGGENLIYKKYFNIGIAVETPNGLVVPVIRDADKLTVAEIAQTMGELAKKARDKKLTMKDMSGACFTISSLGGIGGTHFTPIVNAPEVAILGVSRSKIQPVWNGSEFEPGDILPLSLSYDHRVIDGAEAARFTRHIAAVLADVRRLTV